MAKLYSIFTLFIGQTPRPKTSKACKAKYAESRSILWTVKGQTRDLTTALEVL